MGGGSTPLSTALSRLHCTLPVNASLPPSRQPAVNPLARLPQAGGFGYNGNETQQEANRSGGRAVSLGYDANTDDQSAGRLSPAPHAPKRPRITIAAPRSTVRDSWGWLWKDTLTRVLPLTAAGVVYGRFFSPDRHVGYAPDGWRREALWGAAVGVPLAAITLAFRAWVNPGYRLPTRADQVVQTAFYLAVNAPAEELFWRGVMQRLTGHLLGRAPGLRWAAVPLSWAFATATYGAYHRLGGWSWRSIAGVSAAGAVFGALYQSRPRDRSLVAVTLAHGLVTAAFLSWGDVFLHQMALARARRAGRDQASAPASEPSPASETTMGREG